MWKEVVMSQFELLSHHFLEELMKMVKRLSQYSQASDSDFKPGASVYEVEVLTT
jgi:hypothetical protein